MIPRNTVIPIMQGTLRGKKWTAGSSSHGCWLGSYEYDKQNALRRFLKAGDIVYDIGANVGFYTLFASVLIGESGHVFSFEPLPENLRDLKRHLELNRVRNCTVIDAAVSSSDGEAAFDLSVDHCTGHLATTGTLHVRTLTLDRLIQEAGVRPPNLMKIDIEGAEYECLQGAAEVIQTFRPVIFLATHGREVHVACLKLLAQWRYRITALGAQTPDESDELVALRN